MSVKASGMMSISLTRYRLTKILIYTDLDQVLLLSLISSKISQYHLNLMDHDFSLKRAKMFQRPSVSIRVLKAYAYAPVDLG